ncbi:MAG: aldehyde dehydrogenase family protein [Bacteroidetes bacterium]|nr:aldehyde dehydrogenase family protein [Bacteroidota bacterium]
MLKVVSPYSLSLIKEIPLVGAEDVERALKIAYGLFTDKSQWLPAWQRIGILERVVTIMNSRIEELTIIAAEEGGKPYMDSKVEVLRAIVGVKIAIEQISQLSGEQVPMGQTKTSINRMAFTIREPIGVVVSISAFNHPLNLIIHQTVTAIAAGTPVIIKPALTTPLSCIEFMKILKEAGLPEDWCQCIICKDEDAEILATDSRVNYLSFIGSSNVGWYLRSKLSPGTRCALEHGGVAPVIVEPDADIDELLPAILKGGMYHAGQVCVSVQKVSIHENIIDDVSQRFAALASMLKVGNPLGKDTEVGPLILPKEVDRVELWVNEAVEKGGSLLCGGKRISETCFEPTIILNPPHDVKVSTLEIFGPVVCLYSYSSLAEAIKIANSLPTAFQASVFTKNIDNAMEVVNNINASAVMINDHTAFRVDWMPFGGRDVSGIGIGGIPYTMKEMTREKLIVIKSNKI